MLEHRPFNSLGEFHNEWLHARYHFSFSRYYDPKRTGIGPLIVWNDDTVEPERGFSPHSHDNMEIITYIREGAITHEDRLGNKGRIKPGEVQVMSAGTGITHAEWNHEPSSTLLYQIWIKPNKTGIEPRWEERTFPKSESQNTWQALASGRADHNGALKIHQDAAFVRSLLDEGKELSYELEPKRAAYMVLARGSIEVTSQDGEVLSLKERDGLVIRDEPHIKITAKADSEILLVDVPLD